MGLGEDQSRRGKWEDFTLICKAVEDGYPMDNKHRDYMVNLMWEMMTDEERSDKVRMRATQALMRMDVINKQTQLKFLEMLKQEATGSSVEGTDVLPSQKLVEVMDETIPAAS